MEALAKASLKPIILADRPYWNRCASYRRVLMAALPSSLSDSQDEGAACSTARAANIA